VATTAKTRSILIELQDGGATIVEDIPANAKITFGPLAPGTRDYGPSRDCALRIYTSQSNQLAVFRHVASFRDLSLSVRVREVERKTEVAEVVSPEVYQRQATVDQSGKFVPVKLEW